MQLSKNSGIDVSGYDSGQKILPVQFGEFIDLGDFPKTYFDYYLEYNDCYIYIIYLLASFNNNFMSLTIYYLIIFITHR